MNDAEGAARCFVNPEISSFLLKGKPVLDSQLRSESQPTRSDFTPSNDGRPLVVDLDGTLIKSDLLVEAVFKRIGAKPFAAVGLLAALRRGKAHFKHVLAQAVNLDPASLPYDQVILGRIREAVAAGRPVYLASASNAQFVSAVAEHLGFFTGWFGSDAITNVAGSNKARLLVEAFGDGGFDYIGNDEADLHIWAVASKGMAVRPPSRIQAKLVAAGIEIIESEKQKLKSWIKLFRVHQYVKNTLVFLPLLTAQRLDPASIFDSVLAFLAFSLCASSVYIFNDLVDLAADRDHPTKCNRPLASGAISIIHAALAIPILLVVAMALAAFASLPFLAVMIFYFALTTTYTCWLKTKMLIDVVVLAMLYTLRAIGGAAAIGVPVSEWLLAFSMFIFTSLALIKRYVELTTRLDAAKCDPSNRNYRLADMPIVASCAAAAGFNAVTVFALYISSDTVHQLYHHPKALWLVCPVLMYWIARMLMMAHRRQMHDDPIVFAAKDPPSLWAVAAIGAIMLAAAA